MHIIHAYVMHLYDNKAMPLYTKSILMYLTSIMSRHTANFQCTGHCVPIMSIYNVVVGSIVYITT